MNIISCGNCGTVIDLSRIEEPNIENNDGDIILEQASWNGCSDGYKPAIKCPSCKTKIYYHNGDKA